MKKERLIYFDIIKLIAVICVFTVHFTRTLEYFVVFDFKILPDRIFGVYLGAFGVTLFFITSGASLMYVYDEKLDLKNYIKKRFTGIYPLFWLAYILAFMCNFYINKGFDQTIPKWKILFSIAGFDGTAAYFGTNFYLVGEWFLSVIILLYILFPILRMCVRRFPIQTAFITLLAYVLILQNYSPSNRLPLECLVFARLPEFIYGMIFIKYIKKVKLYMFVPSLIIMICSLFTDTTVFNSMYVITIVGISSFNVFAFLFCDIKQGIFKKISIFISNYSYAIFLSHHYIMLIFIKHFIYSLMPKSEIIVLYIILWCITLAASVGLVRLNKIITTSVFKKIK